MCQLNSENTQEHNATIKYELLVLWQPKTENVLNITLASPITKPHPSSMFNSSQMFAHSLIIMVID